MEAKKTHNLPSASWRPRGADGVIQSNSEGVRIGDSGVSTSLKLNVKENEFTLLSPFALFRPSTIWGMRTPTGEDNLLYPVYLFKCYSSPETPSPTYPEIMSYQLSGHPLDPSSWYIKLTITGETYSAFWAMIHLAWAEIWVALQGHSWWNWTDSFPVQVYTM